MSRFDLYGGNKCDKCIYYVRACDDPYGGVPRCTHEGNLYKNWLGIMYKLRPEAKNMYRRCEFYEEK